MEIFNIDEIKKEARAFIKTERRWLYMSLACLPITLLTSAITGIANSVNNIFELGKVAEYGITLGASVVTWVLLPFSISIAGYFLNHFRGLMPDWKSIYREGFGNYGKYFTVGVIKELIILLWTFVFIIPGFVKRYEYYFVEQLIHDNPNLDHKQARILSKKMTDGSKSDLFILDLSFIPWIILEVITLDIASLYVLPYMRYTSAICYEKFKQNAITTGVAAPEEFGIYYVTEEKSDEDTKNFDEIEIVEEET